MLIVVVQFPFLPLGINWKVVKGVHCPILLNGTGLMFLSSCLQSYYKRKLILDMQFPFLSVGGKLECFETCHFSPSIDGTLVSFLYLPADKSYYKRM